MIGEKLAMMERDWFRRRWEIEAWCACRHQANAHARRPDESCANCECRRFVSGGAHPLVRGWSDRKHYQQVPEPPR